MTATAHYQQHPLSAAFPAMSEADLDSLAEDIKKHGQREPGLIYEGQIIDGWHRYLACEKVGAAFTSKEFSGEDPVSFVLSQNLHRRHLTASQRAAAIVSATNWRPFGDQSGGVGTSTDALAKSAEVSEKTIRHAKDAQRVGLGEEVRDGKVSAKAAAGVAKLPKAKRERAVQQIKDGGDPPAQKPKVVVADRKFERLYEEVKAELVETKESLGEMRDLASSAKAFEEKTEFKEMQVLRAELRSCKRRRDELMAENASMKKHIAHLQKKLGKK